MSGDGGVEPLEGTCGEVVGSLLIFTSTIDAAA